MKIPRWEVQLTTVPYHWNACSFVYPGVFWSAKNSEWVFVPNKLSRKVIQRPVIFWLCDASFKTGRKNFFKKFGQPAFLHLPVAFGYQDVERFTRRCGHKSMFSRNQSKCCERDICPSKHSCQVRNRFAFIVSFLQTFGIWIASFSCRNLRHLVQCSVGKDRWFADNFIEPEQNNVALLCEDYFFERMFLELCTNWMVCFKKVWPVCLQE